MSNKLKTREFVCAKAGLRNNGKEPCKQRKFSKLSTRTGCLAMIRFNINEDGNWSVGKFIKEHNHELAEEADRHLLKSSRRISEVHGEVLKSMQSVGIRVTDAFSYLADEVGGVQNVGFNKSDAYNFLQRERRETFPNGDAAALMMLFQQRQVEDHLFHWEVQVNEDDRLSNFFWIDGQSRLDYDCFGDVIIFDTSYRMNKYNMVCAPFIGVNHHWSNISFGAAFLVDETTDSFCWVFEAFLRAVGKSPITLFTDQDQAMGNAIERVMPSTNHRLCQWHIMKKAPSKIGCFNYKKEVRDLLYRCMSACESEDEFEVSWQLMMMAGGLENNAWLKSLYSIKHKWSTAFNKNFFSLGILSTQRSESTNNVYHSMTKSTNTLTDCFLALEKITKNWRRLERDEDFANTQSTVTPIIQSSPILKKASQRYTRKIFNMFQDEYLEGVGGTTLEIISCDEVKIECIVRSCGAHPSASTVLYNWFSSLLACSCGKFQTMGLLCRHALKVLTHLNVSHIPEMYYLKRWSPTVKKEFKDIYKCKVADYQEDDSALSFRNHIMKYMYRIVLKAGANKDAQGAIFRGLEGTSEEVDKILGKESSAQHKKGSSTTPGTAESSMNIKDPSVRRPKGISNARLKATWEKSDKRKRKGLQQQGSNGENFEMNSDFQRSAEHFRSLPYSLTFEAGPGAAGMYTSLLKGVTDDAQEKQA